MSNQNLPLIETVYRFKPDQYLFEGTDPKKKIIKGKNGVIGIGRIAGPFQEADSGNQNNRIYPKTILEGAMARDLYPEIENRQLSGELDHSDNLPMLKNVSHAITDLYFEGKIVMGEAVLLPTPAGEIAHALYRSNMRVGISARGMGSTTVDITQMNENQEPYEIVAEDYFMITYDLVSKPSHKNALPMLVEQHNMIKLMKLIQENKYNEAKTENTLEKKEFDEIASILMDTMSISEKVKESDEFREWFGNILGIGNIIADLKIQQVLGMTLNEIIELKKKLF